MKFRTPLILVIVLLLALQLTKGSDWGTGGYLGIIIVCFLGIVLLLFYKHRRE